LPPAVSWAWGREKKIPRSQRSRPTGESLGSWDLGADAGGAIVVDEQGGSALFADGLDDLGPSAGEDVARTRAGLGVRPHTAAREGGAGACWA